MKFTKELHLAFFNDNQLSPKVSKFPLRLSPTPDFLLLNFIITFSHQSFFCFQKHTVILLEPDFRECYFNFKQVFGFLAISQNLVENSSN